MKLYIIFYISFCLALSIGIIMLTRKMRDIRLTEIVGIVVWSFVPVLNMFVLNIYLEEFLEYNDGENDIVMFRRME